MDKVTEFNLAWSTMNVTPLNRIKSDGDPAVYHCVRPRKLKSLKKQIPAIGDLAGFSYERYRRLKSELQRNCPMHEWR